ncbi:MAG: PQQ-dependent sugar dehydrogenase [Candidatus Doudnabacteria bacterium]
MNIKMSRPAGSGFAGKKIILLAGLVLLTAASCNQTAMQPVPAGQQPDPVQPTTASATSPQSAPPVVKPPVPARPVQVVATGLNVPWDIVFLPGGDMMVTQRTGAIRRIGAHPATITIPSVAHVGEGGLMGMVLHPQFEQNSLIYLFYTTTGKTNQIVRFKLNGDKLTEDKVIIGNIASSIYHDGGRMAFGPDGMLYITTGDAQNPNSAQDLNSLNGKILRLTADGAIPANNPFGTAVWSYGHRNPQGIVWDDRGRMWETEHGPSATWPNCCQDELNLIEKGKNYGWPNSVGDNVAAGTVGPIKHSGRSIWAPGGIVYVNHSLFFGGLKGSALYEAKLGSDGKIAAFVGHLKGTYGRLRAVVLGPDGYLYITTSNRDGRGTVRSGDDKIIKVKPDALSSL